MLIYFFKALLDNRIAAVHVLFAQHHLSIQSSRKSKINVSCHDVQLSSVCNVK